MSPNETDRILTILVVDDDALVRKMTSRILTAVGYRTCEAGNGWEALGLVAQQGPMDAVVTDVRMPRMNGYDLAAHLHSEFPQLPILFMSGSDVQVEFLVLPGPVLRKPFQPEQLMACLKQSLGPMASHSSVASPEENAPEHDPGVHPAKA
jgi:two-component system, cell cycle sensor histidine kinase and response regulator CckA